MDPVYWILLIIIVFIIILIAFGIAFYLRNENAPTPSMPQFQSYSSWSQPGPSNDPDKNVCILYQFPSGTVNGPTGPPLFIPGTPTYNSNILDSLTGTTILPQCIDEDQIIARQLIHTCTNPTGANTQINSICRKLNGDLVSEGATELFYSNNGCSSIQQCGSTLATISTNFQAPGNLFSCLSVENGLVQIRNCDMSSVEQQFRISRKNPVKNKTKENQQTSNNVGILGKFEHRETGFCLNGNLNNSESIIFNTSYAGLCPSQPNVVVNGFEISLSNCNTGPTGYEGFNWFLMPSMTYKNNNQLINSPQQIVFLDNKNPEEIPYFNGTGYAGFTGPLATIEWISDNQLPSIYWGGQGSTPILARSFPNGLNFFNSLTCEGKSVLSQYLNYSIYNTIASQKACLDLTECVNF